MRKLILLPVLFICMFCSCRHPKELVYTSIQNFSVEMVPKPAVTLDIRLYNPNTYDIKLKSSDVSVQLNDATLGLLEVTGKHVAPKKDTFLLPVTLHVNNDVSLPGIMQQVMKGNVKLKLTGTIKGGRHGFYIRVPVNYEGTENLLSSMK